MDKQMKQLVETREYLPEFMEHFVDQEAMFKHLQQYVAENEGLSQRKISWITGLVYTTDIFLPYMASQGYTLQKTEKE